METLARLGHVARYVAGGAAAGAVFLAQSAIVIVPLSLMSMSSNGLLAGLIQLCFGFLAAFLVGLIVITVIAFPAILLAELIARRTRWVLAPLAVVSSLLAFTTLTSLAWELAGVRPQPPSATLFIASLLPALTFSLITYPADWLATQLTSWRQHQTTT